MATMIGVSSGQQLGPHPKEWPCPIANDILPCICFADEYFNLTMDCSGVQSDEELAGAFKGVVFPFYEFLEFKIIHEPDDPDNDLTHIGLGTLGDTYYYIINIHGTKLQSIEDEAFANSHESLRILDLSGNKLLNFPFESLATYESLQTFRIDDNSFLSLPPIVSASLEIFGASDNRGLALQSSVFTGAPFLTEIHLARCDIQRLPNQMVSTQTNLVTLDLEENEITMLEYGDISPNSKTLQMVKLGKNRISYVRHHSILGEFLIRLY